jgi:acyl-CoA synthetase (AMP-forming)/AMP-acid ligase II
MISHQNVISNVLQFTLFEKDLRSNRGKSESTEVVLGLLPLSHIYGLVVIAHVSAYRGDEVIILPKFEMASFLNAIQRFKIGGLFLVSLKYGSSENLLMNFRYPQSSSN